MLGNALQDIDNKFKKRLNTTYVASYQGYHTTNRCCRRDAKTFEVEAIIIKQCLPSGACEIMHIRGGGLTPNEEKDSSKDAVASKAKQRAKIHV